MLERATDKDAFISALEESAREYSARPPVNPANKSVPIRESSDFKMPELNESGHAERRIIEALNQSTDKNVAARLAMATIHYFLERQ